MRRMICRRRKFRYIKTKISLSWHFPNTLGVSLKAHIVFKKIEEKKRRNRGWNQRFRSEFFKEGPIDQDTKKTYLRVLSTSANEGKEFNANVSEIFTSVIYIRNIYLWVIYIIGVYIRFSWSSLRGSGFICIWSCFIGVY